MAAKTVVANISALYEYNAVRNCTQLDYYLIGFDCNTADYKDDIANRMTNSDDSPVEPILVF